MSDDLDQRLRERLQRVVLPSAPGSLHASLDAIAQTPLERTVRRDRRRTWRLLAVAALVATTGLAVMIGGGSPPPDTAVVSIASPSSPLESTGPSLEPSTGPSPMPTQSLQTPSPQPLPESASLPVRGSAREISDHPVLTAPAPDGGLYVLIPARAAPANLALLDAAGRPRVGWPVALADATFCQQLLPVDDGSVRVVCTLLNPDGNMFSPIAAFALDSRGLMLAGWPVALEGSYFTGRVIVDDLTLFAHRPLGDVIDGGQPAAEGWLATITAAGVLTDGVRVPMAQSCCGPVWAVGPDGVGYQVEPGALSEGGTAERSRITAFDQSGVRPGWPVSIDGIASGIAFGPDGRIVLTVASSVRRTSRVLAFDRDGENVAASSAEIPIATVDEFTGDTGGCVTGVPESPRVAQDGTTFVYSDVVTAVFAVDPSLATISGWPFEPPSPLVRARPGYESEHEAGYCPAPVVPAVGPDGTLYLPLQARDETVGGSIVAVDPDGRVQPGWPVELTRRGAEFWSVVVGSDGTAFALAIEPEAGDTSSASILAIAPDSTVLNTTTIIEP